jgi:protein phosphatase
MLTTSKVPSSAALSDPGRKRTINEDVVYDYTGQTGYGEAVGLFIVCDGLGGYQAGDVASKLVVRTAVAELTPVLCGELTAGSDSIDAAARIPHQWTWAAVTTANALIRQRAQSVSDEGNTMATTITLVLVIDDIAYFAHVGNSRVYGLRNGRVLQITRDHSLAANALHHPQSPLLTRALGWREEVEVDLLEWSLQAGDRLLLCSDGLWGAFPAPSELALWLGAEAAPAEICQRLVDEANRRDGSDNVSAVVMSVGERIGQLEERALRRDFAPSYDPAHTF